MTKKRNPDQIAEETNKLSAPEPDTPEDGFVPFSLEFNEQKQKRKRVLLVVLLGAAALLGIFLLLNGMFSYYQRIMRSLQFDYRSGEAIDEELTAELAACGKAVAAETAGKDIRLQANVYVFNTESNISLTAYRYDYDRSKNGDAELNLRIGSNGSVFYKNAHFEADSQRKVWEISGANRESSDNLEAALLYEYLFTAEDHDDISATCYDSYYTTVGSEHYNCEIWLMTVPINGQDIYFTLYRYYQKNTLCAVRCLTSNSDLMFVYDITGYSLG